MSALQKPSRIMHQTSMSRAVTVDSSNYGQECQGNQSNGSRPVYSALTLSGAGSSFSAAPSIREVPVGRDHFALVDAADYDRVVEHKWFFSNGYAVANVSDGTGFRYTVGMHRFVLGLDQYDSREVDRINHNKLDNTRGNIRAVNTSLNLHNRPKSKGYTQRQNGTYQVYLGRKYIGTYRRKTAARIAYLQAKKRVDPVSYREILRQATLVVLIAIIALCLFRAPSDVSLSFPHSLAGGSLRIVRPMDRPV